MTHPPTTARIAYLTAGAGGMYCGSCMRDNAIAAAMHRLGIDVRLIPCYTPIRTDEPDVSDRNVFFGGINVYLQQVLPLFRWLPKSVDRVLDLPVLIRWATSFGIQTSPKKLGNLTLSMLAGTHGRQRKEVARLCDWLEQHMQPEMVHFSNLLIAGCAPELRRRLGVPMLATLQGDDIFLEGLPEPYRNRALEEIRRIAQLFDGFLVFSRFYADFLTEYFELPADRVHLVPLGIDTRVFENWSIERRDPAPTIGYLARLAPEKGLHLLVDAFLRLESIRPDLGARLLVAGWLGPQHRGYAEEQFRRIREAGIGEDRFQYLGSVDRQGKLDMLGQLDVLSVPTVYRDPKGLFVLEALAAGVPVVQPSHGAFPELLEATGGGRLVPPMDAEALASALAELLEDRARARQLGAEGRRRVLENLTADLAAARTWEVMRRYLIRPETAMTPGAGRADADRVGDVA